MNEYAPNEIYVSLTPEIDFDKLMNLYGKDNEEEGEEMKKDKIFTDWASVKIEFFSKTAFIIELYVDGIIGILLFKKYGKLVEKVKQFTKEMAESKIGKFEREEEDFYLDKEFLARVPQPFPLSRCIEIIHQWYHFTAFLLAFERALKKRMQVIVGRSEHEEKKKIQKSYAKMMDEATSFETELTTYLLAATRLNNPSLFMRANYVKGGFEEAEEREDLSVRVKSLKMNESRLQRVKEENQERKRKKAEEEGKGKEDIDLAVQEEKKEEKVKVKRNKLKLKLVIPKKKRKEKEEIVVDEVQMAVNTAIVEQQKLYTKYFKESIAEEIERKVQYVGLSDCEGCSVGSLSQKDHDVCMTMSFPEKFEMYFDSAVKLLTFENVNKVWHRRMLKESNGFPISKAEIDAYEIAENPRKRFDTLVGCPEELKEYVKSVYSYFN